MPPLTRWLCLAVLLSSFAPEATARVQQYATRSSDLSNLKQIAQATLIYANDHNAQLPVATNIWDYASLLAEGGGLEDARMWISKIDPAYTGFDPDTTLLAPGPTRPRALNPEFKKAKLSVAVPLGTLNTSLPSTTPIAWTRGLQPDGTWAKHSPYGNEGGHIAFIGGNVHYYRNLTDAGGQLTRYDGSGKTANILEALPPGTRIGEYIPTAEEQKTWSAAPRKYPHPQRTTRSSSLC